MKKLPIFPTCLATLLVAGCASDGARMAPIETREVRSRAATVSGGTTRAAPVAVPASARPANPDAPKVMALPEPERAAVAPTALPTPTPLPPSDRTALTENVSPGVGPGTQSPGNPALPAAEAPASSTGQPPPTEARADTRPAAVRQLLQEAEAARQAADFVRARAVLERGVKVAPREPELWYRLAEVAFAERDWEQCQSLAQRASSLAREAPDLRVRAQALEQAAQAKRSTRPAP